LSVFYFYVYCILDLPDLPVVILQTDFPASVTGKIALIKRGTCTFGVKIAQAGAAGAAGAIIYNNDVGPVGSGTLGAISQLQGPYVPMGGLSGTDGTALVAALSTGVEIIGKLHVDATTETRWTSNVLATSKFGNKTNVVMAGGHTDSVTVGPVSIPFDARVQSLGDSRKYRASTMMDQVLWLSSKLPSSYNTSRPKM
jgi:hypothetical protein